MKMIWRFLCNLLITIWYFFQYPFSPNKRKLFIWAEQADDADVDKLIEVLEAKVKEKEAGE